MKVKKSEIQLLVAVIGILIAVCTYFLVYAKFNENQMRWSPRMHHWHHR